MNTALAAPDSPAAPLYRERAWTIDWPAMRARRELLRAHGAQMPPYLVLPEVEHLLSYALDDRDGLLLDTLWHSGARVSEALALTPSSFVRDDAAAFVSLATLKRPGRPRMRERAAPARRLVPLADPAYLDRLRRYLATHRPRRHERLFAVTRQTVNNRLKRVAERADMPRFSAHALRHSFAVNAILHGVPVRVLQLWMGHARIESTEIYTRVLGTETAHFMRAVRYRSDLISSPATSP